MGNIIRDFVISYSAQGRKEKKHVEFLRIKKKLKGLTPEELKFEQIYLEILYKRTTYKYFGSNVAFFLSLFLVWGYLRTWLKILAIYFENPSNMETAMVQVTGAMVFIPVAISLSLLYILLSNRKQLLELYFSF